MSVSPAMKSPEPQFLDRKKTSTLISINLKIQREEEMITALAVASHFMRERPSQINQSNCCGRNFKKIAFSLAIAAILTTIIALAFKFKDN